MRTVLRPVPEELKQLNKMKKYRTKDTHPELKVGIELTMYSEGHEDGTKYSTKLGMYQLSIYQMNYQIEKGYIEEIQEPEFTKSDMIEFAKDFGLYGIDIEIGKYFDIWIDVNEKK